MESYNERNSWESIGLPASTDENLKKVFPFEQRFLEFRMNSHCVIALICHQMTVAYLLKVKSVFQSWWRYIYDVMENVLHFIKWERVCKGGVKAHFQKVSK